MAGKDILTTIAEETGSFFEPVFSAFEEPVYFNAFMIELGWEFTEIPQSFQALANELSDLMTLLESDEITVEDVARIFENVKQVTSSISNLASADSSDFPLFVDPDEFRNEFPDQLIQYLLVDYLMSVNIKIGTFLQLFGVIRIYHVEASGLRLAYVKREITLSEIKNVLNDPTATFKNAYKWGEPDFKAKAFIDCLFDLGSAYGMNVRAENLSEDMSLAINEIPVDPLSIYSEQLKLILLENNVSPLDFSIGLGIAMLPQNGLQMPGFAILPFNNSSFDRTISISEKYALLIEVNADLNGGVALLVRPGDSEILTGLLSGPGSPASSDLQLNIGLEYQGTNDELLPLLTISEKTYLACKKISARVGVEILTDATQDFFVEFLISGGKISIGADGGDGFLNKILPATPVEGEFDLTVRWSKKKGFHFAGSGGLDISIPVHVIVGPISIDNIIFTIKPLAEKLLIETGANIKTSLGPLTVLVNNIGAKINFSFVSDNSGNLGPLQLDTGFKPPSGVGLTLDAGGIKGGGILNFYPDKEEYFGALELEFKDLFSMKAFGIINTRMPDGSDGYSLLIVITAEFNPIQLGFGFTLNGIGGLLGANRTVRMDVLKEGIKTNALKSILFPENVVANINRIISDIKQVFPPQQGHFLILPMAKIGWGTPTLITLEMGLLIEVPSSRLVILGVLKALLPEEDKPLLKLQVNFVGEIDFENKSISFDAILYDSTLLTMTLSGQMALRIVFGDNPVFVLSVGGFHPAFKEIPKGLENMQRLTIGLVNSQDLRITVQTYFAVTSNTFQFGAKAELYAAHGSWNLYGSIGYDILFQFEPFKFLADFEAGVALRRNESVVMGIRVSGSLAGPSPWDAKGKASVSFFFFSVSVPFHKTWGNQVADITEKADLLQMLRDAIADKRNWSAVIPANKHLHVSIREFAVPEDVLVIHPFGVLTFTERIVPLSLDIDKFGNKVPKDARRFEIISTDPDLKTEPVKEQFAPANFLNLTDTEKLARPSFESLQAGFKITGSEALLAPMRIDKSVTYEFAYLGRKKPDKKNYYPFGKQVFKINAGSGSVSKSTLSYTASRVSANAPVNVGFDEELFVIAQIADMQPYTSAPKTGNYAETLQYYEQLVGADPALRSRLQVLSAFELNPN